MRTSYSIGTARRLGALLCLPNMWLATLALGFVASWQPPAQASARLAQDPSEELDTELAALLDEERSEAERLRRGGRCKEALRLVGQHLDDEPSDWRSLGIRGRVRQDLCEWAPAEADLTAAFEAARAAAAPEALVLGLDLSSLDLELGRATRALQRIGGLVGASARRDFLTGRALLEIGNHASAMEAFGEARVRSADGDSFEDFLFRARCERALGQLEAASQSLVTADRLAGGKEADVLAELAGVYLEADGEVARSGSSARRPAELFREAAGRPSPRVTGSACRRRA